ncbi:PrsW family glutamic-type intramembrane protease [Streptomyces cyaneofuscatus]|uniref:PrsW family glutamic-type intramembrane protease n=1 Tax=Streptomyces cyaneofuscatus TaxID=66883 RepID=UPI002D79E492|nr:PrsW family glutamic-type intramembrane protease [Streptomyces cyaneofuscatus]WRO12903.1 PrsW family glutamic-type intramembrane protease [Streptomyces cyaneofuscatus]
MTSPDSVVPSPPPRPPDPFRRPWHIALGIALVLSAAFATAQVLYWAAPEITSPLPWMRIYLLPQPPALRLTRVLLYSGWGVALVLAAVLYGATRAGRVRVVRVCRAAILTVLLLPYAVMALDTLAGAPLTALLCLATSAVALLAVHRVQLYLRLPARLTLLAFAWGALVGSGFAIVMGMWFGWYAGGYLLDFERPAGSIRTLLALFALNADFFSEVGKAAGVALVLLVFRRYVDGVVSGLVLGAASGIGLNLTETVRYMAEIEPGQPAAQFWTRQVVGLLTVHAVFSGLAGAGFGAALRAGPGRGRVSLCLSGLLAAFGGHLLFDTLMPLLDRRRRDLFSGAETLGVLVGVELVTLVAAGPFVVLCLLLLRRGLRDQAAVLRAALPVETASGTGAVTPAEGGLLLSPGRRLLLELAVWRRDGTAGLRHLIRLQQAQLRLLHDPLPQRSDEVRQLKGLPPLTTHPPLSPHPTLPIDQGVSS